MDRRDFMKLLASGALMAMVVPSVAEAFQSGKMSEDELYVLLKDGGEGIVSQEAVVLRREGRGFVRTEETVTHHYRVTGVAEEREYKSDVWVEGLGADPESNQAVKSAVRCIDTRSRKFIPGHRVKPDGTPIHTGPKDAFAKYDPSTRPDRNHELVQYWDDKLAATDLEHGPISSALWI